MMRTRLIAAFCVLGLTACETAGPGYSDARQHPTQLSECTRNALVGAGIGAVLGAATAPHENRGENAAMGAAAGGLGTYGVCKYLSAREQQRVEEAYYQSLRSNAPVQQSWRSDQGEPRSLRVEPGPARDPECRSVSAVVTDQQNGEQRLPPETFCRDANGQWRPY